MKNDTLIFYWRFLHAHQIRLFVFRVSECPLCSLKSRNARLVKQKKLINTLFYISILHIVQRFARQFPVNVLGFLLYYYLIFSINDDF